MPDETVIIRIKGKDLLAALENGVSALPKMDGCFPCLSGVRMKFDSSKPPGKRVIEVEVNGEPIHSMKLYNVATKEYLYKGKDGFKSFANAEMVADGEENPTLDTLIVNFLQLMMKKNMKWFCPLKHRVEKG